MDYTPKVKKDSIAILVAGGSGTRAVSQSSEQSCLPKQFQLLAGKPVLRWSLETFASHQRFMSLIIVCAPEMQDRVRDIAGSISVVITKAGKTRTQSVRNGLEAARQLRGDQAQFIFIHDAARPGLQGQHLDTLFDALDGGADGAAPALPMADALWRQLDEVAEQSIDRDKLVRIQTPQAFLLAPFLASYDAMSLEEAPADDVAVAVASGLRIALTTGSQRLDKITWPEDFAAMEHRLSSGGFLPRVGTSFDAHRFGGGSFVTLCGVQIAHSRGLAGHSDADVAWHAVADAIYGALGAGDIGQHFPPSDPQWRGAPSSIFLKHAGDLVSQSGGTINHLDLTLICELPKIGPHRLAMVDSTAALLNLRPDQVSIKATTTEGMGFAGRQEGIGAQASATILLPAEFRGLKL